MVLSNPGTQHMSLSAGIAQEPVCPFDPQTHSGDLLLCACPIHWRHRPTVTGGRLGRRLHHRAGVHRRRPQGQSSPLWPQWAAAWLLVPCSRTLERPTLGSVRSFCAEHDTTSRELSAVQCGPPPVPRCVPAARPARTVSPLRPRLRRFSQPLKQTRSASLPVRCHVCACVSRVRNSPQTL